MFKLKRNKLETTETTTWFSNASQIFVQQYKKLKISVNDLIYICEAMRFPQDPDPQHRLTTRDILAIELPSSSNKR